MNEMNCMAIVVSSCITFWIKLFLEINGFWIKVYLKNGIFYLTCIDGWVDWILLVSSYILNSVAVTFDWCGTSWECGRGGVGSPCDFSVSPWSKFLYFPFLEDFYSTWGPVGAWTRTWTRAWQFSLYVKKEDAKN